MSTRSRPPRSSPGRLIRSGVGAGILALLALPVGRATAVETRGLGITPAREADYFHLSLLPGGHTTNTAVVKNFTGETARLRLYPVDGEVTPQGQFALRGETEPRDGVGRWLVPAVSYLTLAPHSSARVDFTLAVPEGAGPKDYAGGIVIEGEPRPGSVQKVGSETAVQINTVERLGVRVYLKVEGEAHPHLIAGPLQWTRGSAGGIDFSLRLRNDGNTQLTPGGVLALRGLGLTGRSIDLTRPEILLPGSTTVVSGRFDDPPRYGFGHAEARVRYGDGQVALASTSVRLVPVVLTALIAFLLAGFVYLTYRLGRFVRQARTALRFVAANVP